MSKWCMLWIHTHTHTPGIILLPIICSKSVGKQDKELYTMQLRRSGSAASAFAVHDCCTKLSGFSIVMCHKIAFMIIMIVRLLVLA